VAGHESDGVRVPGPCVFLCQAGASPRAAEHLLWSAPTECSPAEIPSLLVLSYRSLFPLASILRCLADSDVDAGRREHLTQIRTELDRVLGRLRAPCRVPL